MLDTAHAGFDGAGHRPRRVGVGRHVDVSRLRLLHGRPQLLDGELGVRDAVRGGGDPARAHQLEVSRALPDLVAARRPHRRHAVDHAAEPVEACRLVRVLAGPPHVAVAAGLGDRVSAEEQPGSDQMPFLDRPGQSPVRSADIPDGGESAHQHVPEDEPGAGRHVGGRPAAKEGEVRRHRRHVHVGVAEPRHHDPPPDVEHPGVAPAGPARGDVGNPASLDHDVPIGRELARRRIQNHRVREDEIRHRVPSPAQPVVKVFI